MKNMGKYVIYYIILQQRSWLSKNSLQRIANRSYQWRKKTIYQDVRHTSFGTYAGCTTYVIRGEKVKRSYNFSINLYRTLVIFSNSQISKNFQSKHCQFQTFSKLNFTFTIAFTTRGCHSQHKISCHSRICVIMVFRSQRSLIDKQVKHNVLIAKKFLHVSISLLRGHYYKNVSNQLIPPVLSNFARSNSYKKMALRMIKCGKLDSYYWIWKQIIDSRILIIFRF